MTIARLPRRPGAAGPRGDLTHHVVFRADGPRRLPARRHQLTGNKSARHHGCHHGVHGGGGRQRGSAVGAIVQLGILLLIPVGMYFLMIRPQRRRMREQQSLQKELGIGDEIVTNSGIYGFITGFENDDRVWVEIDDDVQIRVARPPSRARRTRRRRSEPTESTDRTTSS
ncbi:MAG: preprotein translocase subunit YajC [Ilumatobacteraceae bacterium]